MILIHEDDYISKTRIARMIAKQYASCQNRVNTLEEQQIARNELLTIVDIMGIYRQFTLFLKIEHNIDLDSNGKD